MVDPQTRKLARQMVKLEHRLKSLETTPQLAHSSIDDYAVPVYDKDGNLVVEVGKQKDGTWGAPPLRGPVPSRPKGVSALGGPGMLTVSWSGEYERDAAPLDFDTLEILVDGVLAGAIPNRDGGTVSISAEQGYRFVAARIRTLVPRHSSTTSPFSVEVGPPADQLFLDAREAIEAAEEQIQQGKDDLEAERLAREAALAEAAETLTELEERLDGIADSEELEELRGQIAAAQEAVEQAQADATAAGEAVAGATAEATAAKAAAETANDNALAAAGIARDKGRIYYQPTAPTDEEAKSPNNLWIDSDDGRVYVWSGTAWTESESESLRDAAQAALVAQQTAEAADSKAQQAVAAAAEADRKAGEAADAAEDARAAAEAAQTTADQATLDAVSAHNEAVAAQDAVDNLQVGARNLLRDSKGHWGPTADYRIAEIPLGDASPGEGELVTISIKGELAEGRSRFHIYNSNGYRAVVGIYHENRGADGVYRVTTRWLIDHPSYPADNSEFRIYQKPNDSSTGESVIEWVKLERGSKGTDWSPAPEDLQAAADAAWERADEAYGEAASKPDMAEVETAITVSANGKNAITVSSSSPSGSTPGVVVGDTWWRVDGSGQIFGQWRWTGSAWSAVTIRSEVIANLDVGKLVVTGSSRFTEAVVDRLFADIFTAHKITASEITIAAIGSDGNLAPNSVGAVTIKDGAVGADKIIASEVAAEVSNLVRANVEKLVVTEGATINEAVILKLATEMITAGAIRTAETGQRVVINESGIVMYGLDANDVEFELVHIGPDGENLITAGDTTISPSGVQASSGTFEELAVGGEDLGTILDALPKGIIAWGELREHSAYDTSTQLQRRAELQTQLRTNRLYRVAVSTRYISNNYSAATWAIDALHYSYDAVPIFPNNPRAGSYQGMSSRHLVQKGLNTVPSMEFIINTEGHADNRTFWVMYSLAGTHGSAEVRLTAGGNHSMTMTIEDLGPAQDRIVKRWNDNDGGGAQDPGSPVRRYTKTYSATGTKTYNGNGSLRDSGGDVTQGLYGGGPSRFNRRGGWEFPSFTGDLSGADVEKIEMYIYMDSSWFSAGATVNPSTHRGNISNSLSTFTSVYNWKRGTGKWITLPKSLYAGFKSGTYKGIGVKSTNNSTSQYAIFKASGAKIRITYVK